MTIGEENALDHEKAPHGAQGARHRDPGGFSEVTVGNKSPQKDGLQPLLQYWQHSRRLRRPLKLESMESLEWRLSESSNRTVWNGLDPLLLRLLKDVHSSTWFALAEALSTHIEGHAQDLLLMLCSMC